MKKKVFIIISLCFTVAPLWAQQPNQGQLNSTKSHIDGGANQILDKISTKYQSYSTVKIDYTCKTEKENKLIDTQKGSFAVKGDKYSFTDAENDYRCDGKTIWNYQKKIKEISIYIAEEDDDLLLNPIKTVINWKKNFKAKFIKEIQEKNITLNVIDITPNTTQNYYKIRLYVDKNKNEIVRFGIYFEQFRIITYYFDTFITNSNINNKLFEINPANYPGIDVNDMR